MGWDGSDDFLTRVSVRKEGEGHLVVARVHDNEHNSVLLRSDETNTLEGGPSRGGAHLRRRSSRGDTKTAMDLGEDVVGLVVPEPELVVSSSASGDLDVSTIVLTAIHDLDALSVKVGRDGAVVARICSTKVPLLVQTSRAGPDKDVGSISLQ